MLFTSQSPHASRRQIGMDWGTWACFALAIGTLLYCELTGLAALRLRWLAVMILSWWLPGLLLVRRWQPPDLNGPLATILAIGVGWCWQIALLILMHWIPGPLSYPLFLGGYGLGALGLLLLAQGHPFALVPTSNRQVGWLLLLLLTAVLLRLPWLGYHEFHQDETHLLRRANEAIRGEDEALARHTKGIGEIAAVMVVYRALNTTTEGTARMPFALASVVSVVALGVLGKRLFADGRIGFAAGLLLAVNGFALGLSRIAQYQGVVLLLSVLAFLAMWEFSRTQSPRWLAFAIILSAFGVVMHYEFLLNALPLLLLLIAGLRRADRQQTAQWRRLLRTLTWASVGGVAIVAATYLPLLLDPYFATTRSYLNSRMAEGQANNFAFFIEIGTLYNSIYFGVGMLLLLLIGLYLGGRRPQQRWGTLLLLAWSLPPIVLYFFVVTYPGTHFYFFMPSWSLLAALPLAALLFPAKQIQIDMREALGRWSLRAALFLWFGLTIGYLFILFFRQSPAYLVNYPETRLALYPAPYGDQIPQEPRFGFPIHEGWKTLGVLGDWGYLAERYASNERSDLLRWYLRSNDRVALDEDPDVVFVARHAQEPDPAFDPDLLEANYQRIGEVRVRAADQIAIWAKASPVAGYLTYHDRYFTTAFDFSVPALYPWLDRPTVAIGQSLENQLLLAGAAYNSNRVTNGQYLHLVLWWQVLHPVLRDYKLFVHVVDAADATNHPLAQWDGWPGQNTQRTSTWPVGTQFADHVLLRIPASFSTGQYAVLVGLYDPDTGTRLGEQAIRVMSLYCSCK